MNDAGDGLVPVNVKIPEDLLRRFDKFWPGKFASRSEAIREGMTALLNASKPKPKQPVAAEVPSQ